MSQIYYIFEKTFYHNMFTKNIYSFDDKKHILTTKQNEFEIPIAFSSVEKAREYLSQHSNLKELDFLNFTSNYQTTLDDVVFKFTRYTIESTNII